MARFDSCPNIGSPEWIALVETFGDTEAMRDFMEYGEVRSVEDVNAKLSAEEDRIKNLEEDIPVTTTRSFRISGQRSLYDWLRFNYNANDFGIIARKLSDEEVARINKKISDLGISEKWEVKQAASGNFYIAGYKNRNVFHEDYTSPNIKYYREDLTDDEIGHLARDPYRSTLIPGNEVVYDEVANDEAVAMEAMGKIAQKLSELLGIKYQFISSEKATEITKDHPNPWKGEPAFFLGDTAYFVGDKLTTGKIFHEFAHPLVRAIQKSNPALFQKIYAKLAGTVEGQAVIDSVTRLYPEHIPSSEGFTEEVMVRSMQALYEKRNDQTKPSSPFIQAIKDLLYQIKQYLRKMFGNKIKVENLDIDTSLEDLIKMLEAGKQFQIETEQITKEDLIKYEREQKEEEKAIMNSISKSDLFKLTKQFYSVVLFQINSLKESKNYRQIADVFAEEVGFSNLSQMKANLTPFQGELMERLEKLEQNVLYAEKNAIAIVNSLFRLERMATKMQESLTEMLKDEPTPDNIQRVQHYNKTIEYWRAFLNKDVLATFKGKIDTNNPLFIMVSNIERKLDVSEKEVTKFYKMGVKDVLMGYLTPLKKHIDDKYASIMRTIDEKNLGDRLKKKYQEKYDRIKITPEKVQAMLEGKMGDAHAINGFMEGYMYSQDPIVMGFAKFVNDNMIDVMTKAQGRLNDFMIEVAPLLEKAGYNPLKPGALGKEISFVDTVFFINDKGELDRKQVWTLLNPHRYTQGAPEGIIVKASLQHDISNLEKAVAENPTKETKKALQQKKKELRIHERMYWTQQYISEYYEREKLFEPVTLTPEQIKEGYSETAGEDAWDELQDLKNDLKQFREKLSAEIPDAEAEAIAKSKQAAISALYNLTNLDGTPKVGVAKQKAEILRKYREESRKFDTRKVLENLFHESLWKYENKLAEEKLSPEEYERKRTDWINANTEVKLKDTYSQEYQRILAGIKQLNAEKGSSMLIGDYYEELWEITRGTLDNNRQVNGAELTEDQIARIKELENLIDAERKVSTGKLSPKKEKDLNDLYKDLNALRYSAPTSHYLIRMNAWLQKFDLTEFKKEFPTGELNERNADAFLSEDPKFIRIRTNLREQGDKLAIEKRKLDPKYESYGEWFKKNHRRKIKSIGKGQKVEKWERLRCWNVTKPVDVNYYESTELYDIDEITGDRIQTDIIYRVPNYRFSVPVAREEYTDANGVTKKMNTPRIVGETIDNKGNWLPKTQAQGAPVDSPYINHTFYALKREKPALYDALEKIKEYHLKNQEGLGKRAKLYMQLPRFRKESLELYQTKDDKGIPMNPISTFVKDVRDWFKSAKDDFEKGENYKDMVQEVYTDMFDDEVASIPIAGKYDLDLDLVSTDLSIFNRYMLSAEKYKKLLEMQPMAKALQKVLNDPDNAAKDMTKISKRSLANSGEIEYANKKGTYFRQKFINNFVDREFYGQNQAGITKDMTWLNKTAQFLMSRASMGFFALNIPSALKNSLSAHMQMMFESAGGQWVTPTTYGYGVTWATKAMSELSAQIYKIGPKSLNVQTAEIFDAVKGHFFSDDKFGTSMSRTFAKDVVDFGWLYNARKWTEMHSTMSLFGAMMKKQKVTQMQNGKAVDIDYIDAWELDETGKIALKKGIDPEWAQHKVTHTVVKGQKLDEIAALYSVSPADLIARNKQDLSILQAGDVITIGTAKKFKEVRNNVEAISRRVQGAYDSFNQPEAQRYLLMRMISYLRKYFTTMLMDRWAFRGTPWNADERYDIGTGTTTQGYYVTSLHALMRTITSLGKELPLMGAMEKRAVLKSVTEAVMLVAMIQLYQYLFDWDPDDEERFEKLRKKSGPLPFPFVTQDPNRPFEMDGWLSNHALNLMMQIRSENDQWIPLPGLGLENYNATLDLKSYVYGPTLEAYVKILADIYLMTSGDDRGYYQRDIGAYDWQKEDSAKIWNHFLKSVGFTGSALDPAVAIKNFQSMQQPGRK